MCSRYDDDYLCVCVGMCVYVWVCVCSIVALSQCNREKSVFVSILCFGECERIDFADDTK